MQINKRNRKRKSGDVFTEQYNPQRIDRLKKLVLDLYKQGEQKYYSISVDGEIVVPKNCDARNFDRYKTYVEGHTQNIEVRMYYGNSPNSNKHIFHLQSSTTLGAVGMSVSEQIQEALAKRETEYELQRLREEVEQKDEEIEKLEEIIEELESKKLDLKSVTESFTTVMGLMPKNSTTPSTVQGAPSTEVEVESEDSPSTESDRYFKRLKANYSEEQLLQALGTWEILSRHPEIRAEVTAIINQKRTDNGKAQV